MDEIQKTKWLLLVVSQAPIADNDQAKWKGEYLIEIANELEALSEKTSED